MRTHVDVGIVVAVSAGNPVRRVTAGAVLAAEAVRESAGVPFVLLEQIDQRRRSDQQALLYMMAWRPPPLPVQRVLLCAVII